MTTSASALRSAKVRLIHAYKYLEGLYYIPPPGTVPWRASWRDADARQARQVLYELAWAMESAPVFHHCSRCDRMWVSGILEEKA